MVLMFTANGILALLCLSLAPRLRAWKNGIGIRGPGLGTSSSQQYPHHFCVSPFIRTVRPGGPHLYILILLFDTEHVGPGFRPDT